jgi:hypothetical protein
MRDALPAIGVAERVFIASKRTAAPAFAANKLVLGLTYHFVFTDHAAAAIEAGMAARRAECLVGILDRRFEPHPATWVAAVKTQRGLKVSHATSGGWTPLNRSAIAIIR